MYALYSYLEHRASIAELLHTDEFSTVDNCNKREYLIPLGVTSTGQRIYDIHEARRLNFTKEEILDKLTGRNRMDPKNPNEPHPVFKEIRRGTSTKKRPDGIKGSMKLLGQCMCPCLRPIGVYFCSCPICTTFVDNLLRFHRNRGEWHRIANTRRKKEIIDKRGPLKEGESPVVLTEADYGCKACNGRCHSGGVYRTLSSSASSCLASILCEKECFPELDLKRIDKNGLETEEVDKFKVYKRSCCSGSCTRATRNKTNTTIFERRCGWDATFDKFKLVS